MECPWGLTPGSLERKATSTLRTYPLPHFGDHIAPKEFRTNSSQKRSEPFMSSGLVTMIDDRLPKTRWYTQQSPVVEEVTYLMEGIGKGGNQIPFVAIFTRYDDLPTHHVLALDMASDQPCSRCRYGVPGTNHISIYRFIPRPRRESKSWAS